MQQIIGFSAWLLVALVAAALVMVAAGAVTTERFGAGRGVAGMLSDVKGAWASLRGRGEPTPELTSDEVARIVDAPPVETSMSDFFLANLEEGAGYVQAAEITARLEKAADVVRTTVPQRGPRSAA
ncbi:hypothetical protein HF995_00810 [Sanguibacter hominis ATCC BAA-789]|uniref:Uncharacterized protein n=1 Tax=Sanguibacter hominis ATCC BAA-789 TaxID=1312740 RepID=A0A9X5F9F6_9MICO|nr:hypothetical protein [Sanguibacter hominis]NKX91828.1 hypothetical protein [Sanguibacter hominis ATCC BAA-789]